MTDPSTPPGPWAMPLAFEVRKSAPPTTTAVNEASAKAVALVLADERALTEWAEPLASWGDVSKMRKVVRRGAPAHFARAEHLAGVSVEHAGAKVRAFVPGPTDQLHADLRRLQVSGSELELGTPSVEAFLTVWVNPGLVMSTGKSSAQCGHAAQLAWLSMSSDERAAWRAGDFSVRVLRPSASTFLAAPAKVRVFDAGHTEIPAGSLTTLASW